MKSLLKKRKIRKLSLLILGITIISSCGKFRETKIINSCNSAIEIELHFDQGLLQFYNLNKEPQIELINELTKNSNTKKLYFDTINYISTFGLNQNDTLYFTLGMDTRKVILLFVKEVLVKKGENSIRINDYETIIELMTDQESNVNEFKLTEKLFD